MHSTSLKAVLACIYRLQLGFNCSNFSLRMTNGPGYFCILASGFLYFSSPSSLDMLPLFFLVIVVSRHIGFACGCGKWESICYYAVGFPRKEKEKRKNFSSMCSFHWIKLEISHFGCIIERTS